MHVGPVKTYYEGTLSDYLQQCRAGSELMAEYLRRLETVGITPGGGACFDEIVCTSPEQSESIDRIFRELCAERGLEIRES